MTPEQKEALKALDEWVFVEHAHTIKDMLAEPRVPGVDDHAAIDALRELINATGVVLISRSGLDEIIRIMREPPKPATKTVEVWRVEWAERLTTDIEWRPRTVGPFIQKRMADGYAKGLAGSTSNTCIRVTGPHNQEVPAT